MFNLHIFLLYTMSAENGDWSFKRVNINGANINLSKYWRRRYRLSKLILWHRYPNIVDIYIVVVLESCLFCFLPKDPWENKTSTRRDRVALIQYIILVWLYIERKTCPAVGNIYLCVQMCLKCCDICKYVHVILCFTGKVLCGSHETAVSNAHVRCPEYGSRETCAII